jgi:hypothetical protein
MEKKMEQCKWHNVSQGNIKDERLRKEDIPFVGSFVILRRSSSLPFIVVVIVGMEK